MKKVLFVISTLTGGGAERVVSNLTLELCRYAHIDILVNSISDYDYPVRGNIISLGMKPTNHKTLWYQFIAFFKRYVSLRRLKRDNNYDACISIMDSANIVNILTNNKYCDNIVTAHNTLSDCKTLEYRILIYPLVKLLYNKADKIVCVSKGVARDLINNFNVDSAKTCTIYNGFEDITNENINEKRQMYKLITVGRLEYQKGHIHLIRAFSDVVKNYPNSVLYIVGEGSLRSKLENLVNKLGLDNKVVFCGFISEPQKLLKLADIFVFSSNFEGFGNVLIEAMQCGLPVITTDYPYGGREILAPNTDLNESCMGKDNFEITQYGVLTPVCSGSQNFDSVIIEKEEYILSSAIKLLCKDRNLRDKLAMQGLKRTKDFSVAKITEQWCELLDL